jgi:hypothetical protein
MTRVRWIYMMAIGTILMTMASLTSAQTSYDTFPGNRINANLWFGREQILNGPGALDTIRSVKGGRLFLGAEMVGALSSSAQVRVHRQQLRPLRAGSENLGMAATFHLIAAQARGCSSAGTLPAQARAGLSAALFNDGSSSGAGDQSGDIGVVVLLNQRSDLTVPIAEASLFRCTNAECSPADTLIEVVFGAVTLRQDVLVAWQWLRDASLVAVRVNDTVMTLPYTQAVGRLVSFRGLEAWVVAPPCPEGEPSFARSVTAVDNVFVIP